jgi:predicted RNA-binding protein with PUA-like domain
MTYWLLKTEPSDYSFDQLERDRRTIWDGVGNNLALQHMRTALPGDLAIIYHTGDEKAGIGLATIVSEPYADPAGDDPKRAVFDVEVGPRFARPVTLAAIKADPAFADFVLVRNSRLSAMPVPEPLWQRLLALAG